MDISVDIRLLRAPALDGQEAVVVQDTHSVSYVDPMSGVTTTIDMRYNAEKGELFVFANGVEHRIGGFPTQAMANSKRGKRGIPGTDGQDGYDGREGRTGRPGCPGIPGHEGEDGEPGDDAEDGPDGQIGGSGCKGPDGNMGFMGAVGPTGPDGARGNMGYSCVAGPTGPDGPTPYEHVVLSDVVPTDPLVYLWGQPIGEGEVPVEPEPPQPMSGRLADQAVTLAEAGGFYYQGIAAFNLLDFKGGVGPYRYSWNGTFDTQDTVTPYETGTQAQNLNLKGRTYIATNGSARIEGNVQLVITDLGDGNKTLILNASYVFTGRNTSSSGGGSGGGGCFVYGSNVILTDGTTRPIQQVAEGDSIVGLDIDGLPDSTGGVDSFLSWSTEHLEASNTFVSADKVQHGSFSYYLLINGVLKSTVEEHLLVLRNGVWSFIRVKDIVIGDSLYHVSGETHEITSIERVDGICETVSLNVETVDTYFVDGYLVHNVDTEAPIHKE